MKPRIASIAIVLSVLATVASAQTVSMKIAGVNRSVIMCAPSSGLSKPALVLVLHGLNGDGAGMRSSTQFDKVADRERFVVAYPNAVGGTWDYAGAKNDYAFLKAIIDTAVSRHGVDRERVYVTGFSQGGGEAVYAAFNYPDVFAAVAPVSSVGSGAPTPRRPVPILLTFGTKDLYTPATFMASVASWVKFDSCAASPKVTRPYPATNARSVVTRIAWENCAQGTQVVVDSIQGGGHEWPNNTATKVDNTEEVWAFFKRFKLARTGGVGVGSRSPKKPLAAFYRSGTVFLEGVDKTSWIGIFDSRGALHASAMATEGKFPFHAQPGTVYLLQVGIGVDGRTTRMIVQ